MSKPLFPLIPVKEAIRIIEETMGWRYVGTKVERWSYDWRTTHKQGDYGVASMRVYIFERPSGNLEPMSTAVLRSRADSAR